MNYMDDVNFLYSLDNLKIKTTFVRLSVLDFVTEEPIGELQGVATAGNISVSNSSPVRRTLNLTLDVKESSGQITDTSNLISIRTKINVSVGMKNPLKSYESYGDVVWFPQGVYVVATIQLTRSSNGIVLSIQARDKMALLDGTMGGTLPASTTFHEIYEYDEEDNITITHPTIPQIIREAVHHIGGQPAEKVIVSDLDEKVKMLVKYDGDTPLWFAPDYSAFIIADAPIEGFEITPYVAGRDVGYRMTDFTYPGELTMNAGDTVQGVLDKIAKTLGNYEYFFDIDGNFIFQQIKNYQDVSYTPIVNTPQGGYVKNFSDSKYSYAITNANTVVSYQNSPKCTDVKNDFIVWGNRSTSKDHQTPVRYHLAIDVKPVLDKARQCMWAVEKEGETIRYIYTDYCPAMEGNELNLLFSVNIHDNDMPVQELLPYLVDNYAFVWRKNTATGIRRIRTDGTIDQYWIYGTDTTPSGWGLIETTYLATPGVMNTKMTLIGKQSDEWREELYRQALEEQANGEVDLFYGEELLAEWRKLYDCSNSENANKWRDEWHSAMKRIDANGNDVTPSWTGWNPKVYTSPQTLDYWLDFIDNVDSLAQFSINIIGRRTKAVNDNDVKSIYNMEVPDIVFVENSNDLDTMKDQVPSAVNVERCTTPFQVLSELMEYYNSQGQDFCLVRSNQIDYFKISSTPKSAYDEIRSLIYQHLTYNSSITITCQPKYYLDVNKLIHIEDYKSNIVGDYIITSLNIPLTYNGTMSLVATEALTRI